MITIQAGYALVVDDEPANRDFVERLLQTASFKVVGASTGAEGLKAAQAIPDLALALIDQQLPDATGLEIIRKLRADNPEAILVMATMHDDRAIIDEAFGAGADVFLVKPHGFMELYRRLKEVDSNTELLRRLIIDQYGPRPYRGQNARKTQEMTTPPAIAPSEAPKAQPTPAAQPAPAAAAPQSQPTPAPAAQPAPAAPLVQLTLPVETSAEGKSLPPSASAAQPAVPPPATKDQHNSVTRITG